MDTKIKRTTNVSLQTHLDRWLNLVDTAISFPNPSMERTDAVMMFCRAFVSPDVSEDDIEHFSGNLIKDEVRFTTSN